MPNHAIRSTDRPSPNPSSASDRMIRATTTAATAHTMTSEREAIRTRLATRSETTSGSTYSAQSPLTRRPATASTSTQRRCAGRSRAVRAARRAAEPPADGADLRHSNNITTSRGPGATLASSGASGPAREAAGTSAQRFETAVHDSSTLPSGATSEVVGDERPVGIRKVMIPASRTRPSSVNVPTRTPPICRRCSSVST